MTPSVESLFDPHFVDLRNDESRPDLSRDPLSVPRDEHGPWDD